MPTSRLLRPILKEHPVQTLKGLATATQCVLPSGYCSRQVLTDALLARAEERAETHEQVCRRALDPFTASLLRELLLKLRRNGLPVWPITQWGGIGKEVIIKAFISMDAPAASAAMPAALSPSPGMSSASSTKPALDEGSLVAVSAAGPQLRQTLEKKWFRGARRRLKSRRQAKSQSVKAAVNALLARAHPHTAVHELRDSVAKLVGFQLNRGEPRFFFDRLLLKLTQRTLPPPSLKRRGIQLATHLSSEERRLRLEAEAAKPARKRRRKPTEAGAQPPG